MEKAVVYYRVSTKGQAKSGLGLDVQHEAVDRLIFFNKMVIEREFSEIESGSKDNRPTLLKAVRYCKRTGAILIIAKIDRLARKALFVAKLINMGVKIIAADKPFADHLELLEDAIEAEREGDKIRKRTKAALAAAKARGTKLGTYGANVLSKRNREAANVFALEKEPLFLQLHQEGFTTLEAKAKELNRRRIWTFQGPGYQWHATTIFNILARIKKISVPTPQYIPA